MRRATLALLAAVLAGALTECAAEAEVTEALVAGSGFAKSFAAVVPRPAFQEPPPPVPDTPLLRAKAAPPPPKWLWVGVGAALAIGGSAVSAYSEQPRFPWHFENEGWFGQNTSSGGADKLGHAFSAYVGTRVVTQAFEALGNAPEPARRLAAWSTLAVMLGIEILDGYSRQYRFSPEDAVMDVVGVGLGYLLERNRKLDNLVDFRLLYRKSESSSFDPAGDYSGQTYLLVAKASGVPALRDNSVLRYFELARSELS